MLHYRCPSVVIADAGEGTGALRGGINGVCLRGVPSDRLFTENVWIYPTISRCLSFGAWMLTTSTLFSRSTCRKSVFCCSQGVRRMWLVR